MRRFVGIALIVGSFCVAGVLSFAGIPPFFVQSKTSENLGPIVHVTFAEIAPNLSVLVPLALTMLLGIVFLLYERGRPKG